jgi:23S rRNA (cytidine1920-2'-O)/16S rRNA (cytidine1409-2'-O)-methyltransferase
MAQTRKMVPGSDVSMKHKKERLDVLLLKKGFFKSREKARAEIMAGNIYIAQKIVDKPGTLINEDSLIEIKEKFLPYVSRGGLKLEKALNEFNIKPEYKVALDAGASTGGFTDCLLKNGAKKVFAVDVGYGQLDYGLRQDERVVVMERKNVRFMKFEDIGEQVDIITADLSFISLTKVFDFFSQILKKDGDLIALIKPQFEVGRDEVGKKGVVRDTSLHIKAINTVIDGAKAFDFYGHGLTFSPIKGPKGNVEFLIWFKMNMQTGSNIDAEKIVELAHQGLL